MVWRWLPRAWVEGGGRESPGVRVTFFRVAERKSPKKGRPRCLRPCASLQATCGARAWGALRNSLRACGTPLKQPQRVSPRSVCPSAHATPRPALLGAYRGDGERTSIRAFASLGPSSWAQAPRAGRGRCRVERSDDPCGCSVVWPPPPSGCACAGAVAGWQSRKCAAAS